MNLEVGKCYFVRTSTDHWLGKLKSVDGPYVVTLEQASWVAESGRFHDFLKDGHTANMEIEPIPDGMDIVIQWQAIIKWPHKLLRKQT